MCKISLNIENADSCKFENWGTGMWDFNHMLLTGHYHFSIGSVQVRSSSSCHSDLLDTIGGQMLTHIDRQPWFPIVYNS